MAYIKEKVRSRMSGHTAYVFVCLERKEESTRWRERERDQDYAGGVSSII